MYRNQSKISFMSENIFMEGENAQLVIPANFKNHKYDLLHGMHVKILGREYIHTNGMEFINYRILPIIPRSEDEWKRRGIDYSMEYVIEVEDSNTRPVITIMSSQLKCLDEFNKFNVGEVALVSFSVKDNDTLSNLNGMQVRIVQVGRNIYNDTEVGYYTVVWIHPPDIGLLIRNGLPLEIHDVIRFDVLWTELEVAHTGGSTHPKNLFSNPVRNLGQLDLL